MISPMKSAIWGSVGEMKGLLTNYFSRSQPEEKDESANQGKPEPAN